MSPIGTEIGDLLVKDNQTPQDKLVIRDWFSRVESVMKHFTPGDTFEIERLEARSGIFTVSQPMQVFTLKRNDAIEVANNTLYSVEWQEILHNDNGLLLWDSTDPTKISLRGNTAKKYIQINTYTRWEAINTTGIRQVFFKMYDIDDTLLDTALMEAFPGTDFLVPGIRTKVIEPGTAYMIVQVFQTEGQAIDLDFIELTVMLMD